MAGFYIQEQWREQNRGKGEVEKRRSDEYRRGKDGREGRKDTLQF